MLNKQEVSHARSISENANLLANEMCPLNASIEYRLALDISIAVMPLKIQTESRVAMKKSSILFQICYF